MFNMLARIVHYAIVNVTPNAGSKTLPVHHAGIDGNPGRGRWCEPDLPVPVSTALAAPALPC